MTTKKSALFLSTHQHIAKIGDKDIVFRPLRVRALNLAKDVIASVTKHASMLMDPSEDNYVESTHIDAGDGGTQTTTKAISVELAEHRSKRQEQQLDKAFDGLLSSENMEGIATLLLDSMRETEITPAEMIDEVDLGRFVELIGAMFKANMKVFGPMPGKAQAVVNKLKTRLGAKVADGESPESELAEMS